jgi:hypothetical protein
VSDDPQELERIVQQLEAFLAQTAVEVKRRHKYYYDNGLQKAEVDVVLIQNTGSSKMSIGLECRLRRQSGPQGSDWIMTIAGKQRLTKLQYMVAVSATGFTRTAILAADELGIGLRTVDDITNIKANGWFTPVTVTLDHGILWSPRGVANITTEPPTLLGDFDVSSVVVFQDGRPITITDAISNWVDNNLPVVPPNEPFNFEVNIDERMLCRVGDAEFTMTNLHLPATGIREVVKPTTLMTGYTDPTSLQLKAWRGVCEVKTPNREYILIITGRESPSIPGHMDLRLQRTTLKGEELLFEDGAKFTLYGVGER